MEPGLHLPPASTHCAWNAPSSQEPLAPPLPGPPFGPHAGPTPPAPQVQPEERVHLTAQGLLLRALRRGDSGVYVCAAVEQGFSQPLRRVALHVLSAAQAERLARAEEGPPAAALPGPKLWYRDFLQLVEPGGGGGGGASSLRMCRPQPPAPAAASTARRKGRNRRTHDPEPRAERGPRSAAHW